MNQKTLYFEIEKAYKSLNSFSDSTLNYFSKYISINENYPEKISDIQLSEYLIKYIDVVKNKNPQHSKVLFEKYINNNSTTIITQKYFLSKDQVNRYKRAGLTQISKKIMNEEKKYKQKQKMKFVKELPFFDGVFYGREIESQQLIEFLNYSKNNKKILISGIGGIGKSAFVNKVLRDYIETNFLYKNLIWIRIPNEIEKNKINFFLETKIKDKNISNKIIVLDNINHREDYKIINKFIDKHFLHNSKVIYTSRYRPITESEVDEIRISEIEEKYFKKFFKELVNTSNIDDTISQEFYKIIGGNPLAIKVTTSLINIFSPEILLENFSKIKIDSVEDMFNFIFSKSWEALNINAQKCLMSIPVFQDNSITIKEIADIAAISLADVINSISILYERSLIEVRGSFIEKDYGIHFLTYTFLNQKSMNEH